MSAQSNLSPRPSPVDEPGEASWRLWETLKESQQTPDTAEPPPVDPSDRLPLSLLGRCLTPDGIHVVCEAVAVTSRGLTVACEVAVQPGERIVANFHGLGEIGGVVDRSDEGWFVLDLRESPERLAALSKRLLWTIRRQTEGAPERRLSERIDQKLRETVLKSKDGRETRGELIDMSATGAAVRLGAAAPYFWVGQEVFLGARSGLVRRHFAGGIGIEFDEARAVDQPF
jgi:hypothetical protein